MPRTHAVYPDLKGRHVLVTGGAAGIGAAVVEAFARQGSQVSVLDKDADRGAALAERLGQKHPEVRIECHGVDLTNEDATIAAINAATASLGPVNVLINNAGVDPRYDLTEMTSRQWDDLFAINLKHMFVTARQVIPSMIEGGGGSIINVSSINYWVASARLGCYAATKAAIVGLTKSMAAEFGKHMIRVNAIAPGWTMTEHQIKDIITPAEREELIDKRQALPIELTPELLAPTFLFLASDVSKAITRQVILVDAGLARG